ncbi:MAG TPA: hypothetical protein V6C65_22315 [Allocoleopsis sp.]
MSFYRIALCVVVVFAAIIAICEIVLVHRSRGYQQGQIEALEKYHQQDADLASFQSNSIQGQIDALCGAVGENERHRREMTTDIQLLQVHVQEQGRRLQAVENRLDKLQVALFGRRELFAWPIAESDYQKAIIYNVHPAIGVYADEKGARVHCAEELNGGGYRNGKYVYLKDLR